MGEILVWLRILMHMFLRRAYTIFKYLPGGKKNNSGIIFSLVSYVK